MNTVNTITNRSASDESLRSELVHNIKNKIMSVKGFLHLLAKQYAPESKEKLFTDKINTQLNAMTESLEELNKLVKSLIKNQ